MPTLAPAPQKYFAATCTFDVTVTDEDATAAVRFFKVPGPAHDALGDAYHTALICSRLNLTDGIAAYEKAAKEHENGFHGYESGEYLHSNIRLR